MITGVFIERNTFKCYIFQSGTEQHRIWLCGSHTPLLHTVTYRLYLSNPNAPYARIIDASRIPWNIHIYESYFGTPPLFQFNPLECPSEPSSIPDSARWINFEKEYPASLLVPGGGSIENFGGYLEQGDFEGLVCKYGGVNPRVLARYFHPDHDLIKVASVLEHFTTCMKTCGKVWMGPQDLAGGLLDVPQWLEQCQIVIRQGLLVRRDTDHTIAFSWAANLYNEFYPLVEAGIIRVVFSLGKQPSEITKKKKGLIHVDPKLPIDRFIDTKRFASSFFPEAWIGVPSSPLIPPSIPNPPGMIPLPWIYITDDGNPDPKRNKIQAKETIKLNVPFQSLRKGEIIQVSPHPILQGMSIIHRTDGTTLPPIQYHELYQHATYISEMRFDQLKTLSQGGEPCGIIIAVKTRLTPTRWLWELEQLRGRKETQLYTF